MCPPPLHNTPSSFHQTLLSYSPGRKPIYLYIYPKVYKKKGGNRKLSISFNGVYSRYWRKKRRRKWNNNGGRKKKNIRADDMGPSIKGPETGERLR